MDDERMDNRNDNIGNSNETRDDDENDVRVERDGGMGNGKDHLSGMESETGGRTVYGYIPKHAAPPKTRQHRRTLAKHSFLPSDVKFPKPPKLPKLPNIAGSGRAKGSEKAPVQAENQKNGKKPELPPLTHARVQEKLEDWIRPYKKQAEDIVNHKASMEDLLIKTDKQLRMIPKYGRKFAYIPELALLLKSYVKGEYRDIPLPRLIFVVAVLVYFVSPVNISLETVPVLGQIDDAILIGLLVNWCSKDINNYMKWLKANNKAAADLEDPENPEEGGAAEEAGTSEEVDASENICQSCVAPDSDGEHDHENRHRGALGDQRDHRGVEGGTRLHPVVEHVEDHADRKGGGDHDDHEQEAAAPEDTGCPERVEDQDFQGAPPRDQQELGRHDAVKEPGGHEHHDEVDEDCAN